MKSIKDKKPKYATKVESYSRLIHEGREDGLYCNVFFDTLMHEHDAVKKYSDTVGNVQTRIYVFPKKGPVVKYEHVASEQNTNVRITAIGTKKQIKSIVDLLDEANELVSVTKNE